MPPPYGGWDKQEISKEMDLSRQRYLANRERKVADAEANRGSDMINANNAEGAHDASPSPKSPKKVAGFKLPPMESSEDLNGATTASSGDELKNGEIKAKFRKTGAAPKISGKSSASLVEELNGELLEILRGVD